MKDESANPGATNAPSLPAAVDRATFQAELDKLRTPHRPVVATRSRPL